MASSVLTVLPFFLLLLSGAFHRAYGGGVGINYGQIANNLPSVSRVQTLLQSLNISRVKLYDADPNVLRAFADTNVEFIIGLGNELLQEVKDPAKAQSWIEQHVKPYLPRTKITSILVGNEVFMSNDLQLEHNLLPAMQTVYKSLVSMGLDKQVSVTTAHSLNILANSYPPSSGSFKPDIADLLKPLLDFHAQTDSPFLINVYPFFAYKGSPGEVSLDYALFQPNQGMTDPVTNLKYDNMLYAQLDAVYAAIKAMGHTDIEVRISETGWPSKGDSDEAGATPHNAGLYNGNLLKRVLAKESTPGKPSVPIDVHFFALFNENLKPGPASERNYGLFYPDGSPVYNIASVMRDGKQSDGQQRSYLPDMVYSSSSKMNVFCLFNLIAFLVAYLICS